MAEPKPTGNGKRADCPLEDSEDFIIPEDAVEVEIRDFLGKKGVIQTFSFSRMGDDSIVLHAIVKPAKRKSERLSVLRNRGRVGPDGQPTKKK